LGNTTSYTYDNLGRVLTIALPRPTPSISEDFVIAFTYYHNSQGKNSQLLQSDGIYTYTWDNNGNLLTKGSTDYTWDYDDRLVDISSPTQSMLPMYMIILGEG